jgi:hypothetical protein
MMRVLERTALLLQCREREREKEKERDVDALYRIDQQC